MLDGSNGKGGVQIPLVKGAAIGLTPATAEFRKKFEHNVKRAAVAKQVHTEHFALTPPDAAWLLTLSRGNRKVDPKRVRTYRDAMHARQFLDTGQGLQVTCESALANGHHRMAALSGCTPGTAVRMAITFGLPALGIQFLDTDMRVRSEVDRRVFEGKAARSNKEAAIARAWMALQAGRPHSDHTRIDREVFDRALDEDLRTQFEVLPYKTQFAASYWGAIFWAYPLSPEKIASFAERTVSAANHAEGSPPLLMREFLIAQNTKGAAGSKSANVIQSTALYLVRAELRGATLRKKYVPDWSEIRAWFEERLKAHRSEE